MRQDYEVIRFVQQNGRYHVVMDCVEGELLSHFIVRNPSIDKRMFWTVIANLAKELKCLENSGGIEFYPVVTPYHIVVKKDGDIALLKFSETHSRKYAEAMKPFLSQDRTDDYIFSYGKILQFLLAKWKSEPKLTWKEIRRIKKIIQKCLQKKINSTSLRRMILAGLAGLCVGMTLQQPKEKIIWKEPERSSVQVLEDYLKGESVFSDEILQAITEYEENIIQDTSLIGQELLMNIYLRQDTKEAKEEVIKRGEMLLDTVVKNREVIANIYLERDEIELAAKEYRILVEESPTEERYLTYAIIEEQCGRHREALKICEQGSAVFPEGKEIQLQYIRLLLADLEYEKQVKKEKLESFLSLYPSLQQDERLEQLQQEYGYESED